ncbi:MAG: hypothetical protein Q8Q59_06775 [Luteolibacter sp.]|jgi:hypothetical protein|nr:hypothetical protein [Luteolibacter sp.]
MTPPPAIRSLIPLVIGLAVGGVGATLFLQSMPGAGGSPEQRAAKLEVELKRANNRIASLEADPRTRRDKPGRSFADGARNIAEDIREGRPVSPEDIFHASQPLMRDLAPLFDRMRIRAEKQRIDQMTGELARKYDLSPGQQTALRQWFEAKSEETAKQWSDLVGQEGTRLEDVMRASRDVRPDDGLDAFMERTLTGDKLTDFRTTRMTERAESVQRDADMRTERLDGIVKLDDSQRDQVFGIMARNSRDYDPAMKLEGAAGEIGVTNGTGQREVFLSVLRPDQREAYQTEQQRRRESAQKDMEAIGLTLPPDWDPLDMESF